MKPSFDIHEKERQPHPAERRRRRRLTPRVRVIVVFLAAVYALYCYFISKPLLAHPLPQHTGPYAVGDITIPAAVDAPLTDQAIPTSQDGGEGASERERGSPPGGEDGRPGPDPEGGFPVIIFSHGTVSSRTDYSHFAGELAARGHVVVMMEHREGSCLGKPGQGGGSDKGFVEDLRQGGRADWRRYYWKIHVLPAGSVGEKQ
ncbi:hypothetical protein MYCTH_2129891 [Thermothelomyces thermophilus ATCC 42464]|uniref:1-alkyl-2-acetylglycerophosphocholine esterase n=1 Tax=Thermothelomyces thermophilus (strain ATCC 42464 / BCRC 31852 / DSM 1799) TaxID=573729 RepID=G2QLC9_THET4|nr:uncharacterized protein MYCTH_2129891 [Thermothelomyces thermophilus ATCC 42464]AEO60761.1 hypothetical protein MYCTH_2129891 [Thermothelomyces thermophilus ATCC 42464]